MAIAQMAKIIMLSHTPQASELREALQREGNCHILNADEAIVSRDFPDIGASADRPKDIEGMLSRLQKTIAFLGKYAQARKGLASVLSPRTVINEQSYNEVVSDRKIQKTIEKCEHLEASREKTRSEIENLQNTLEMLRPWSPLETPVEEIGQLLQATCWAGLIPNQHYEQIQEKLRELGAAIQKIGPAGNRQARLVACRKDQPREVQKALGWAESDPVNFESMTGTASELISEHSKKLEKAQSHFKSQTEEAAALSENLLNLEILHDPYKNLLSR